MSKSPQLAKKYALVADDDETMRDILFSLLTNAGYSVRLATCGREALTLASKFHASIAILDLAMMDGNGLQTCAAIRRLPKWRDVPIIILTHYPINKALKACLRAGANGFMCKPLILSEFLLCLEAHTVHRDTQVDSTVDEGTSESTVYPTMANDDTLPPFESEWILDFTFDAGLDWSMQSENAVLPTDPANADQSGWRLTSRVRVLLGDDHLPTQKMICRMLAAEDCVVDTAHDGCGILEKYNCNNYDLVLMTDRISVGGSGIVSSIRALDDIKGKTPIIVVMHRVILQAQQDLEAAGVNGFLMEPLTSESLSECLQQHLFAKTSRQTADKPVEASLIPDQQALARVARLFAPGAMAKFLEKLVESVNEVLLMVQDDRREAGPGQLANLLHNLAGTAGTLGCHGLTIAARNFQADQSGLREIKQEFIDTARASLKVLDEYLKISSSASAVLSSQPDAKPLLETPLHVLVVDDVAMVREIAGSLLRGGGHYVTFAASGEQAIMAVEINDFDLVLMDFRMPGIGGLEATRCIRTLDGKRGRVPIVGLTAQDFGEQAFDYGKAGMDGLLSKPFDRDGLLNVVAGSVRGRQTYSANAVTTSALLSTFGGSRV